jgi:hypothetical protein
MMPQRDDEAQAKQDKARDAERASADRAATAERTAADDQAAERAKLDAEVAELRTRLAEAENRSRGAIGGTVTVNARGEVVSE